MSSGDQCRRRNVGDIRAFLKWAVEEKGAPDRCFSINTKAANKYIGVVPKGQKFIFLFTLIFNYKIVL